ncbi:amino acid/amide ABC transporter substrate-binding protein, HAAT family [Tindallia magadiensis]|uniref:Amino acid/amide ABC transporter substrate-binding protein, HAAT family n=1 Tax=Tindallia magadiensis TaxID=69895 RepID=A0A1I3C7L5_9FIRM|nr:ABC transporter substrate-binding protein [Tindallia magadiensis]SFH70544.1 amino acid/amide ABC transporter substrate-binding protein, HAAT family [Tindallia magadiensis]
MKTKPLMMGLLLLIMLIGFFSFSLGREEEPLFIGFSAGLTGAASELGVSGRNGLMIAVQKINEAGGINGREVKVVVKDDENDPQKALEADEALYQQGVKFIIGHMTSNMAEKTLPFINEKEILMVTPTMSSDELSGKDDYLIRVVSSNRDEAIFMAEIYHQKPEIRRVMVLYDQSNHAYTSVIRDFFAEFFETEGEKQVMSLAFSSEKGIDYLETIEKVVDSQPDALIILSSAFDAAIFCQQIERMNVEMPILLSAWSMTTDLISHGGIAVEGVRIVSLMNQESEKKEYQDFADEYRQRYEEDPSFSAVFAHDAAMVLFEGIKALDSKEITPQQVKESIIDIGSFQGLQSLIEIDEYGDASREIFKYTIQNGQFVKVE